MVLGVDAGKLELARGSHLAQWCAVRNTALSVSVLLGRSVERRGLISKNNPKPTNSVMWEFYS